MLGVLYGAWSHLARASMRYLSASPFHSSAIQWNRRHDSILFAPLASFADHLLFPSPESRVPSPESRVPTERTAQRRSEENTSQIQSIMRISYAVFFLTK